MNLLFGRNKKTPRDPADITAPIADPGPRHHRITLDFSEFRPKMVPSILRPLRQGEDTRIEFELADVLSRVAGGVPAIRISDLYRMRPDLFGRPPLEGEDADLLFPWNKVWHQIDATGGISAWQAIYREKAPSEPPDASGTEPTAVSTPEDVRKLNGLVASALADMADAGQPQPGNPGIASRENSDHEADRYAALLAQFQRVIRERGALFAELNEVRAGIESERCEMRRLLAAADERCRAAKERAEAFAKAVELRDRELATTQAEISRLTAALDQARKETPNPR